MSPAYPLGAFYPIFILDSRPYVGTWGYAIGPMMIVDPDATFN